jgi:large conductance mechanosensitive channel
MWKEFKAFAFKGNVLDLAIGVIIGAAFGQIVSSAVNDLITPILGIIVGGLDFKQLSVTVGEATILYGNFIQSVIDFLLIAVSIFLFVKLVNKARRKEAEKSVEQPAPPEPSKEELLLAEIRDLLKAQKQG